MVGDGAVVLCQVVQDVEPIVTNTLKSGSGDTECGHSLVSGAEGLDPPGDYFSIFSELRGGGGGWVSWLGTCHPPGWRGVIHGHGRCTL